MKTIAVAAFASVTLTCAIATHTERRLILGGETVSAGTKSYNVGLHHDASHGIFCGGALISPTHVLTSPECINISNGYPLIR